MTYFREVPIKLFLFLLCLTSETQGLMRGSLGKASRKGHIMRSNDDVGSVEKRGSSSQESLSPAVEVKIHKMDESVQRLEESIDSSRDELASGTSMQKGNTTTYDADKKRLNDLAWAHFQQRIDMCIGTIRGGSDVVAKNLIKAIDSLESVNDVCPLLKRIQFPKLYRHGYVDETSVASKGKRDVDIFFSSQKEKIFRCMCEFMTPLHP